jgi:hypothetical protein
MLRKFVCVGFRLSQGEGAASWDAVRNRGSVRWNVVV